MMFVAVFLAMALADVAWTLYFLAVNKRSELAASAWSATIVALGSFTVTEYVRSPLFALAAVAGAFVGTYLTLRFKRHAN